MKWLTPVFALSTLCIFAQIAAHTDEATIINPHQMKWGPVAAIPGTELAVLSGSRKGGPLRRRVPRPGRDQDTAALALQ